MPTLKFKNPNTGEWEVIGYGGDMYTNTYDPQGKAQDIFQYVDDTVAAIPTPDVSGQIEAHDSDSAAHADIRAAIPTKTSQLTNTSGYVDTEYVFGVVYSNRSKVNDFTDLTVEAGNNIKIELKDTETDGYGNRASGTMTISVEDKFTYGTTDLTAGSSSLTTGTLYFVYE